VTNNPVQMKKVVSSSSVPAKTPLKHRIRTYTWGGQTYDRIVGWIYPPKKKFISPSAWKDPHPYSCTLMEGDITHFQGTVGRSLRPADPPSITFYEVGDLPVGSNYPIGAPAIPSFNSGLESRAVNKALNQLKNEKINLAVAFAERGETTELLLGTLHGLAKAARSLRNGDMRGVARGLALRRTPKSPRGSNFSQKWLELQYGWRPLYSDVFGAVAALHAADQDDPKRYMTTVTGRVRDQVTVRSKNLVNSNACWGGQSVSEEMEGCFVRLDYYLENPFLASLASLGITNPAVVLWERVPFSFVVDWFLPIASYLSGFDAALGYKFRAGTCSRLFRRQFNSWVYPKPGTSGTGEIALTVAGAYHQRQIALTRTLYSSSPLPRFPGFKNPFPKNGEHISNALALFISSLRLFK